MAGTFRYIKIPSDEKLPPQELSGTRGPGDVLMPLLKPIFAACGKISDEAVLAWINADEDLSSAYRMAKNEGRSFDFDELREGLCQNGAESVTLAVPSDTNEHKAVLAYADEASSLKKLPVNSRAMHLARLCGMKCELRGDVYVGRTEPRKRMENIDFTLADLDQNATWMQRASHEGVQAQQAVAKAAGIDREDPKVPEGFEEEKGPLGGYSFKDLGEEVEVLVYVEKGTVTKDVKVEFKKQEVRITSPVKLELGLFGEVQLDGCYWTLGPGGDRLVINLEKVDPKKKWAHLLEKPPPLVVTPEEVANNDKYADYRDLISKITEPETKASAGYTSQKMETEASAHHADLGYTWRDADDELELVVIVKPGTTKNDVKVEFRKQELRMTSPVVLNLKLFKALEVDGCGWTLDAPEKVVITLAKLAAGPWKQLLAT